MAYSFRQNLFEVDGLALCFDVSSCYDAEELESIIEFGGGRTDKRGGQYTISFHTRNSQIVTSFNPPRDLYCSDFILKCCIMNTILPLKKYLLQDSMFISDFEPNDVLLQKLTWKDAQRLYALQNIAEVKVGCVKINGKVPIVKLENLNGSNLEKNDQRTFLRHNFSQNDRQKIVDFFVSNSNFVISNQSFWEKMAEGFSVHTWQSLKNHFRLKIYPYLKDYKLSDELVENIRTQMETKRRCHVQGMKVNENLQSDSDSDLDLSRPQKKRRSKTIVVSDGESSDASIEMDEQYSFCSTERAKLGKNGTCQPDESSEDVMEEIPSQEEEHETENFNGSCLQKGLSENSNSDSEEWSSQTCKSPSSSKKKIQSQEEELGSEMKSMQDISIQCDCDEATVTDSFAQTEAVEVLPLPDGWDYPTTFADALELMRSAVAVMITSKEDVQRSSPDTQVTAAEKVNPSPTRRTKHNPSKENSVRRSPRQQPKKTRSGSSF
ncbi:uncharacterized protein LOC117641143 [Thrips palmi]|uniref:Telomeric repeat-binding factor 2-interacting protein 1 n=1 Tax=Thrips palmi TaxID=161013 RepID=A0A6P8YBJ5_THRPL|nr:uncharacterized protein LOC117641143 [Thrips palmi]